MSTKVFKILESLPPKDILVIGNGFDLASGYKTSYEDFLFFTQTLSKNKDITKFLTNDKILAYGNLNENEVLKYKKAIQKLLSSKNYFLNYFFTYHNKRLSWADFEEELEKIVVAFDSMCNLLEEKRYYRSMVNTFAFKKFHIANVLKAFTFSSKNNFYLLGYASSKDGDPCVTVQLSNPNNLKDEESVIAEFIKTTPDLLYKELFDFSDLFGKYLLLIQKSNELKLKAKIPENVKFIINYNYTDIISQYFNKEDLENIDIYYINGHVDTISGKNNLIFGINNKHSFYYNKFTAFYKTLMRITKLTEYNRISKITNTNDIHIFGHSLTTSDADSIFKIVNNCGDKSKVYIYYYDGLKTKIKVESNINSLISNYHSIFKDNYDKCIERTYLKPSSKFFKS